MYCPRCKTMDINMKVVDSKKDKPNNIIKRRYKCFTCDLMLYSIEKPVTTYQKREYNYSKEG